MQLLTAGIVACLVSDTAYGAIHLYGAFRNGTIVDLGWALFTVIGRSRPAPEHDPADRTGAKAAVEGAGQARGADARFAVSPPSCCL